MKLTILSMSFLMGIWMTSSANVSAAEQPKVGVKDIPADSDTSVIVQKGKNAGFPNYEVVNGSEEIAGDPNFHEREAYTSWKTACDDFKKELKEMNKERLMSVSCGRAKLIRGAESNTSYSYVSSATYKLLVRIRDTTK